MKKILLILLVFLMGILIPLGCTNQDVQTGINSSHQNVLRVYNWSTYIVPEVLAQFEKEFGVTVKYDTYESSEDLYAKLKAGNSGYDVIFPSDSYVTLMAKNNLLEKLNLENIPNIKNLDKQFLKTPFDPENKYSLPYLWGTMGAGYNIKKTKNEIDSWREIFDSNYKSKISLVDELRSVLGGVLIYLGYNPNTTKADEINQAKDFMIKYKKNIAVISPDNGQLLLNQGKVNIALEWSGDIFQVMKKNPDIRYGIPQEGSIIWIDNIAIAKNAPNQALAEKFINFLLEAKIAAQIANYTQYATPNRVALERGLINQKQRENSSIYPPPELLNKLFYIEDLGVANKLYNEAWKEIKLAINSSVITP